MRKQLRDRAKNLKEGDEVLLCDDEIVSLPSYHHVKSVSTGYDYIFQEDFNRVLLDNDQCFDTRTGWNIDKNYCNYIIPKI